MASQEDLNHLRKLLRSRLPDADYSLFRTEHLQLLIEKGYNSTKVLKSVIVSDFQGPPGAALPLLLAQKLVKAFQPDSGRSAESSPSADPYLPEPPIGPPKHNLGSLAVQTLQVHSEDGDSWVLLFRDKEREIYVDPGGNVEAIERWLCKGVEPWFRLPHDNAVIHSGDGRPVPLFLSGLRKTGKSFTLGTVLPSVIAQHERFGVGKPSEPLVLFLNGRSLARAGNARELLQEILGTLMMQLVDLNVPVDPLKWRGACRSWGTSESALSRRIIALLEATRCPLLILFDELEAMLLPLYNNDAAFVLDMLLRRLLLYGPRHVLWALTGYSRGGVWIALEKISTLGLDLVEHCLEVHLPASYMSQHMELVWREQVAQRGPLPEDIFKGSKPTPAFLVNAIKAGQSRTATNSSAPVLPSQSQPGAAPPKASSAASSGLRLTGPRRSVMAPQGLPLSGRSKPVRHFRGVWWNKTPPAFGLRSWQWRLA